MESMCREKHPQHFCGVSEERSEHEVGVYLLMVRKGPNKEVRPADRRLFRLRLKVISKLPLLHVSALSPPPPSAGVSKSIPVKNDQTVLKVTAEK